MEQAREEERLPTPDDVTPTSAHSGTLTTADDLLDLHLARRSNPLYCL